MTKFKRSKTWASPVKVYRDPEIMRRVWPWPEETTLNDVAEEIGIAGRTLEQRRLHELERDGWERYLGSPRRVEPVGDGVIPARRWGREVKGKSGRTKDTDPESTATGTGGV